MPKKREAETYSLKESAQRFQAALLGAFKTPPTKPKPKKKAKRSKRKASS
ncbi:MAG: hypothetical protein IT539_03860 [Bradyrhizobiaceae bacterium]|nr:hypothetical protein [Bradyrhizobiaceae bacterium]